MVLWEALDALSHQLELCQIDASRRVVALIDTDASDQQRSLVRAGLARTGAETIEITVSSADNPRGAEPGDDRRLLPAVTNNADVIVTAVSHIGPSLRAMLDAAPCHVLHLGQPGVAPEQYPPHANLLRRVDALRRRLGEAGTLHLEDNHGSSLEIALQAGVVSADHGVVDDANPHATFPAGWVEITPAAGSVNGELVVMPGDANATAGRLVSSPLRLRVQNDFITAIEGDNPDADVLRALFEYAGQPDVYGFAGVAFGMNAGLGGLELFDERLAHPQLGRLQAGVVTITFGNNLVAKRPSRTTVAIALARRSVTVDHLPLLSAGQLEGNFAPDVYES